MPRPRSEKARQAVLAAMRRALAAEGYAAVTIEGLAQEAEVAKQTIYRWWPSKAAILGEALLDGDVPGMSVDVPMTDDLAADLHAWFTVMYAQEADAASTELARALIAITATDADLGRRLNERLAAPIREWVDLRLARARERGELRAGVDAAVVADHLVAVASYAALLGQPVSAARVNATVEMLLRGIAN